MDPAAPTDFCPHCQNCGGVGGVRAGGPWKMYSPFEYKRGGITMCGDPVGKNDHTSKGQYANPPSMPFAATYKPGSIANFECTCHRVPLQPLGVAYWPGANVLLLPLLTNPVQMILRQTTMASFPSTSAMSPAHPTRISRTIRGSSRRIAWSWSAARIRAASLATTKCVDQLTRSTQAAG
jgi:hypothetical protein